MTSFTEPKHAGEFLKWEVSGGLSRDQGILASGQVLGAGAVLGKITSGGKYAVYNNGASDGTQVAAGILYGNVDASGGDTPCVVVVRVAEIWRGEIDFADGMSDGDIAAGLADLAAQHVIAR